MLKTNKMIGNKIAAARKRLNISQAQLAQNLFISPQAVGKWERGESMPDIITLTRLAEILGVDLNYFSESFQSMFNEKAIDDTFVNQSNELTSKKQRNKLSWDMSHGNWVNADFSGLKNLQDKFSSSNMQNCKFIGSEMSGLHLKSNNVDNCDFTSSNFSGSHIQNSFLNKNIFKDCSLKDVEFLKSYVSDCDFSNADFTKAVAKSGGFEKNSMTNAILNHTSFIDTLLADIVFDGTIEDCYFENCKFTRVTFQNLRLINTFFKCKSLKRIRFVDCKADRMTYEFLKNGKADLSGITLLTS
ncbi:MAG TPA: transcriptional regulator [Bacteroidales bacterium]|nr:MAG: transcriptional regulator [Bacteroidetes bacterium GWF2_33_38]OFY92022.1 MAG: transcriptional regulator [Bacteroidetes bacterium RIFOXYA2_FULL_33_7]HBF89465.1 transcriptional regulator [Bacteroidales bacterium]